MRYDAVFAIQKYHVQWGNFVLAKNRISRSGYPRGVRYGLMPIRKKG